jgi:putative DNA primase/helicase
MGGRDFNDLLADGGEDAVRAVQSVELGIPPAPGTSEAFEYELAGLPCSDIGNAARFIRRRGHDFLWVKDAGWNGWNGKHWDHARGEIAVQLAAQDAAAAMVHEVAALEAAGAKPGEDEKAFADRIKSRFGWALRSGDRGRLSAMQELAAPQLMRRQEDLDAEPFLFNVDNGTLYLGDALEDGSTQVRLHGHDRADYLTRVSPVGYDPDATERPNWTSFLDLLLPSRNVQRYLQRFVGYCLTGATNEQCLVCFHGEGRNGKSTLIDLIAWLMGSYAASVPINSLLANDRRGGSDPTPDLARLPGMRMVRSSEPRQGSVLDESLIKQLTGGEPITVRHLNQGFFEFRPQFKLILTFNRRPTIRGDDDGIWRRLHLVPFDVQIPVDKVDREFLARLKTEGPAILNWALDGYRMWREEGLAVPEEVSAATGEYRAESDRLGGFLGAACEITGRHEDIVGAAELYTAYTAWCRRNAVEPMSQNSFGRRLGERRRISKARLGTIRYLGLKLVDRTLVAEAKPA